MIVGPLMTWALIVTTGWGAPGVYSAPTSMVIYFNDVELCKRAAATINRASANQSHAKTPCLQVMKTGIGMDIPDMSEVDDEN